MTSKPKVNKMDENLADKMVPVLQRVGLKQESIRDET